MRKEVNNVYQYFKLVSKTQLLLLYLGLLQYFDHHGQIETIAKNFKIFFWPLQVRTCVYAYRTLRAWIVMIVMRKTIIIPAALKVIIIKRSNDNDIP